MIGPVAPPAPLFAPHRPRVALILPSATYRAPDFMAAAEAMGVEVVVVSEFRQAMGYAMGDRSLMVDLCDEEAAAEALFELGSRSRLDAVVAVDDQGVGIAAAASARLGLAHNPIEAVRATRDKLALRRRLEATGLSQPRFTVLSAGTDPGPAGVALGWPVVVKPRGLAGSRGVIRADDIGGARTAAGRVRRILAAAGSDPDQDILMEAFVPGAEVAVEAVLSAGHMQLLAVFDKPDPLEGPYFEETIYVTPSRHPAGTLAQVEELVIRAARCLGLREGPVHAEARLSPEGPVLLELAARSIGGLCSRTLRFGAGISLEELLLRHALGLEAATLPPSPSATGVMMIPIPAGGRLVAVSGLEAARGTDLVQGVEITIPPGGRVVPLPEGDRYLGFIFAAGPSAGGVESALRRAHAQLRFAIEPDTEPSALVLT
jgi:biotin carboxylase